MQHRHSVWRIPIAAAAFLALVTTGFANNTGAKSEKLLCVHDPSHPRVVNDSQSQAPPEVMAGTATIETKAGNDVWIHKPSIGRVDDGNDASSQGPPASVQANQAKQVEQCANYGNTACTKDEKSAGTMAETGNASDATPATAATMKSDGNGGTNSEGNATATGRICPWKLLRDQANSATASPTSATMMALSGRVDVTQPAMAMKKDATTSTDANATANAPGRQRVCPLGFGRSNCSTKAAGNTSSASTTSPATTTSTKTTEGTGGSRV
jgi:hypothetical protein